MMIQLIQEIPNPEVEGEMLPVGTVIEVDDATGEQMVADGVAVVYDEEAEAEEEVELTKSFNIKAKENKMEKKEFMSKSFENQKDYIADKHGDNFVGKAFKAIATKATTGANETTAADGGNLVYTAISEIMGIAVDGSKVWAKCPKMTLPDGANAIKVPVDNSDPWIKANAITPTNPAEGAQKTATKLAFDAKTLTLTKTVMYLPATDEILQDVGTLDAYIRNYARGKLATVLDYEILAGGGGGYSAISGNADCTGVTITEATPTTKELYGIINSIDPRLQAGSEWFMSVAQWTACVGALADADNLFKQLIDVSGKQLLGYPVTVMPCLNDITIFGNLSQYQVAVPRNNDVMAVSTDIRFDYDETVYRLVHRGAGNIVWKTRTAADSQEVSAFSEGT